MSTDARYSSTLSRAERRGMFRDGLAVLSSSHFATVCGVVQNLIVMSIVPPRLTGIWTAVRSMLDYGNYSSLGVNRAAGIEVSIAGGRQDELARHRLGNVAMTVELAASLLVSFGLVALAVQCWLRSELAWSAAALAGALFTILSRYYAFNLTMLRAVKQFPTLARARAFGAVTELGLFVTATYFFHFYGLLAAALAAQLIAICYIRLDGKLRFNLQYDAGTIKHLIAIGWPLAAEAFALASLRSIDRFVIVACLANGSEQLGWYKIAIMMGAWAFDQSNLVAGVLFPRLGEMLGKTHDPRAVLSLGMRAAELIALGMVPCIAALLAIGSPIVSWLLPAYRPGLVASAGLVTAAAMLGTSMPLRYALLTIGRTRSVLALTGLSAVVSLTAGLVLLYGSGDTTGGRLAALSWSAAGSAATLLISTVALCMASGCGAGSTAWRVIGGVLYMSVGSAALQACGESPVAAAAIAALWSVGPVLRLARQAKRSGLRIL